jgi:serine/threonine protein kinase
MAKTAPLPVIRALTQPTLNAPPALNAIVFKCLAKSPADRFQAATELKTALENASTNAGSRLVQRIKQHQLALAIAVVLMAIIAVALGTYHKWRRIDSIAVLPLDIQSSDPEADYISDGITESISNTLARLPGLRVIPTVLHSITNARRWNQETFALNSSSVTVSP